MKPVSLHAKVKHKYTLHKPNGDKLGEFDVISEWEGFLKLQNSDGTIIAMRYQEDRSALSMLHDVLSTVSGAGTADSTDAELIILKCSPIFVAALQHNYNTTA